MKTTLKYTFGALLAFLVTTHVALAADAWPASTSGTNIASSFPTYYEVSGLAWDDTNDYLYAVSDGSTNLSEKISRVNANGENYTSWTISGDPEAITVTGTNSYLYIGDEGTNSVKEFNPSTGSFTGKNWSFGSVMVNSTNAGLEGLAYIPAGDWYDYGVFVALQQSTGTIYVGRPDFNSSSMTQITTYTPATGQGHPADLFYSFPEKRLYVLYDDGFVRVLEADGTYITDYTLPTSGQEEGFAIQNNYPNNTANIFIGLDNTVAIYKYSGFPQTYPVTTIDADNDGYNSDVDCNDTDRAVYTYITYYRDADGDTYGSATNTTSVCTNVVPTGYVTNASDANDADYDNDGVSYTSDCNDADSAVSSNRTYYRDADGDTLGDPNTTTSICDNNVPYGYVTNANDTDDTQAPVTEIIPSAPTNLLMERLALRKMRMTWNGSGDYYNVKLTDVTAGKTSTFTDITGTTKTVGKNYIFSRHIYTFSVQACNDQGCSAYTNSSSFKAYSIKQWRRIQRLNRNR